MVRKAHYLMVFFLAILLCAFLFTGCNDAKHENYGDATFDSKLEKIELDFNEAVNRYSGKKAVMSYVEDIYSTTELLYKASRYWDDSYQKKSVKIEDRNSYTIGDLVKLFGEEALLDYYFDYMDVVGLLENEGIEDYVDLVDCIGEGDADVLYNELSLEDLWKD